MTAGKGKDKAQNGVAPPVSKIDPFELPDDLVEQIETLSSQTGESARFIIIAAVEHFLRIPEQQRKAVLRGAGLRRKG
jgi:predicted transcriptional regulator